MKFNEYTRYRDQETFFESVGFNKSDISEASEAMQEWVSATEKLFKAMDKVPETQGEVGGMDSSESPLSGNPSEQAVALEVQRARHTMQEANLEDLLSRVNQYAARLNSACESLV